MEAAASNASSPTYFCHSCSEQTTVTPDMTCTRCGSGAVEEQEQEVPAAAPPVFPGPTVRVSSGPLPFAVFNPFMPFLRFDQQPRAGGHPEALQMYALATSDSLFSFSVAFIVCCCRMLQQLMAQMSQGGLPMMFGGMAGLFASNPGDYFHGNLDQLIARLADSKYEA